MGKRQGETDAGVFEWSSVVAASQIPITCTTTVLISGGNPLIVDHIGFVVSDHKKSKAFYLKSLAPLGIEPIAEDQGWSGFGKRGESKAEFWFGEDETSHCSPIHIALLAESRDKVDQFYEAAIAAGGKDNGRPGLRAHYHANYYGAFVIDPDGNNIEAVFHGE